MEKIEKMKTLTFGDVTYEIMDEQARNDISNNTENIKTLSNRMDEVEKETQAASDHANAKGSQYASGLYKIATNSSGHVTDATPVTLSDITSLGVTQSDWNQTDSSAIDYIENKPDIVNGSGKKSIVIGTGNAQGDYSVAGGTNDKNLVADLAGSLISSLASIDTPTAYGDMSLSFGAGTKSYSTGSVSLGANSTAGCLGFYWHSIDWTGSNPVIQLTTEQKPLFTRNLVITTQTVNKTPTWNNSSTGCADLLSKWKVGDAITIVNNIKYGEKAVITAIDSTNGKITVKSLPFTSADVSFNDISVGLFMFDDIAVYCPAHPNAGVIQFALGSLSLGLQTNASGSFSTALGYNTKVTTDFGHAEGYETVADYSAHAEGYKCKALGRQSHAEGNRTQAGYNAHAEGTHTYAGGHSGHSEGYCPFEDTDGNEIDVTLYGAHGMASHSEGYTTLAKGQASHAEGNNCIAQCPNGHAEGWGTSTGTANDKPQHVQGKWNVIDSACTYAHIVGNGSSNTARSNAHTLDWNGNAWYQGEVKGASLSTENSVTIGHATLTYDYDKERLVLSFS